MASNEDAVGVATWRDYVDPDAKKAAESKPAARAADKKEN